ncbi:hypothetical protein A374_04904 [Fictibacillus macauensis ZFHKF-1]|uniref:Uncharacterized protein n=1 Tax=Fictibacillus macauensis ZFHKF-1 TaxID=1196324 RepID=I8UJ22_9BACL|nr:hypothetical protein [Fictibacillus macauensis]EIT86885.1 hypothetical protein A374_04904 [Fictibacillus macauensis ZFHKF-1]
MYFILRLFIDLLFVGLIFGFALIWSKTEELIDKLKQKGVSPTFITFCQTLVIICSELFIVWYFSNRFHLFYLDTLFSCSIIFPSIMWIITIFSQSSTNYINMTEKFYIGTHYESKRALKVSVNPFTLGTLIFTLIGIVTTFSFYYHYFIT